MTKKKSLFEQMYSSSTAEESIRLTMNKIQEIDNEKRLKKEISTEIDEKLKQASKKQKKTPSTDPAYYTREEVAEILNVPVKTVVRQLRDHKMPGQEKPLKKWMIHKQTFDKYLLKKRQIEIQSKKR